MSYHGLGGTYCDLANSECLVLVLACAPFNGGDEALPDALHKLRVGERLLPLFPLDRGDDLSHAPAVSDPNKAI